MKFPKLRLPFRRGGRTEDEVEDEKVEEEEEELGEVRGLGRTSTASLPVAPISAARPPQKKRSRLLTVGVAAFLLVICSICALVYLAIPDAGSQVDISALPPSTQTAVWIETKVAEVATQYAPRTPVSGQGSLDAKATPSVVKAPISGGLGPTATVTITPTVIVAVYIPPWQKEYDSNWEILGTLFCLAIPVIICILLAAWLWRQTLPLPAREVTTLFSYPQGNITVKWSISAKLFARILPLLRVGFLKKDALSQVIEYLQTVIQTFGAGLQPGGNIRDDIILFFGEFNQALKAQREGSDYRIGGRIANNPKARRIGLFLHQALPELREREERFGIEVIEFFVAEDCAEMDATLQTYLAETERQVEEDREAKVERARQLVEEERLLQQQRKEAEEALRQMTSEAEAFAAQLATVVFKAGIAPNSPQADALTKLFVAQKEAEIRARAEEKLARLRLDLDREIAQRSAAAREREVEADGQRARGYAQFAEAVNKLASALDGFDLTEALRIFASSRQTPSTTAVETASSRGDGSRVNDRSQRGG